MKNKIILSLIIWCTGTPLFSMEVSKVVATSDSMTYDYAIIGGTVIDGTGAPGYRADLLIKGEKIAFIGSVDTSKIHARVINAHQKVITPGFIDAHAHGDPLLDDFNNFISMGVTTILLGQDGQSPVNSSEYPNAKSFFDTLQQRPKSLNLAFLAGHGSIRNRLGYDKTRNMTSSQIEQMNAQINENIQSGCFGLSMGLEYLPGSLANLSELQGLALTVGESDGILMSHLRSEDDEQMNESLTELFVLSHYCRAHVSHLKVVYGQDPARATEIIKSLEKARTEGQIVTADVYPYLASYTGIGIIFPPWAKTKTDFELAKKSRKKELESYLYKKIMSRNGPTATLFASRPFVGKTLAEVAEESGKSFVEILMTIGPQGATGAYFVMNEAIQEAFILDPEISIGSDGGPWLRHPRSYGTFAKIIQKYVTEENKISLELAIRKMTGLTAQAIGLTGRGEIKTGHYADLLIFDPLAIKDNATFADPFSPASGFDFVLLNGKLIRAEGKPQELNAGTILLKGSKTE